MIALRTTDQSTLSEASVAQMIFNLQEIARRNSSMRIDFDNRDALSGADYTHLTGLGKQSFNDLHHHISETIRNTPARSTRVSLAIFLLKLKSGMSNKLLSTLFNITKWSVRRSVAGVRKALVANFVPNHIGFQHITVDAAIGNKQVVPFPSTLTASEHSDQALVQPDLM